jgi:ribosomal protein S27E
MPPRLLIVILVCLAVLAPLSWYATRRLAQPSSDLRDVMKRGQRVHVACANPSCGYEQADYRAHSQDTVWPKTCPKCGQQTLCRAVRCHQCRNYTPWQPDAAGRVICRNCQTWLNPSPGAAGTSPATP